MNFQKQRRNGRTWSVYSTEEMTPWGKPRQVIGAKEVTVCEGDVI